jgi:hypothetical protein
MEELHVAITHLCHRSVHFLASALRALRGVSAASAWFWLVRAAAPGGFAAKVIKAGALNVRFPDNISRGARGGPERRTQVVELASGDEERNASWANSRRRYDVA